jgi:hypothetical protein
MVFKQSSHLLDVSPRQWTEFASLQNHRGQPAIRAYINFVTTNDGLNDAYGVNMSLRKSLSF